MDFSKTKLYQRTRSGYQKLYLEFNEKKSSGKRRRTGGNGRISESDGDCVTVRVGEDSSKGKSSRKSSEVLQGSDKGRGRNVNSSVARRTRQALRERKLGIGSTKGESSSQVYVIDDDDNDDDDDGRQNHLKVEEVSESEKSEEIAQSGPVLNRGKNVSKKSLIDELDDDDVELSKRCGKNKSKKNAKGVSRKGKGKKDGRSLRTKDIQQNNDAADDDDEEVISYLGDSCKLSKSSGMHASEAENVHGFEEGGFGNEFDKDKKDSSLSSRGFSLSSGFRVDESDEVDDGDVEGITFLGDDDACLDDYDPSHSSHVESNEVKVIPDVDVKLQGVKSSEEEDDDPQKLASPEEVGIQYNVAAHDTEVISLSSSSDSENGEKDGNAIIDDGASELKIDDTDDISDRLEEEDIDDLSEAFWAELLQIYKLNEGPEQENNDSEPHNTNLKPVCKPKKKTEKVNKSVVSKKRCVSSDDMWKPVEKGSKKSRTDADFSIGLGKINNKGGDDTFWQVVDERGPSKDEKITSFTSYKYDQFGSKINVVEVLKEALREEGGGDNLLKRYVDIDPEEIPSEQTQVDQVQSYKFKFKDEEDIKPEKLESEMEVDGLFDEMNMCLQLSEIGSSDTLRVKCGDADFLVDGTNQATCCRRGKHKLTINDEFGIICRYCSYVEMEVRDILPPLCKNGRSPPGRHDQDRTDDGKYSNLKLPDCHQESHHDSKGGEYEKGTVWDLVPGAKETMYPHQREGFEFIWNRIAGGTYIDKLEKRLSSGGSGCIISHAPGTGKSRLTIVFLQAFLKMYPSSRPLIVAPRSMLLTWEEEFKKWNADFPFFNLNNPEFSGQENKAALALLRKCGNPKNQRVIRDVKLFSWKTTPSVLGITYRLFESLAGEEGKRKRDANNPDFERNKNILLKVPTLLVLDEGHTPRNDQSQMWKTLVSVKTKRSIILSGTPFQNNFDELYNTLSLVNPMLSLGSMDYSKKRGGKHNSAKGQWDYLTSSVKESEQKLQELRAMIDPFVHVHKGTILQEQLPGLRDALVVLKPTKTQQTLLKNMPGQRITMENNYVMSLVSVHPSLLLHLGRSVNLGEGFRKLLQNFLNDPHAGIKTNFLMELIKLSGAHNEKVLVFSQYIQPLKFIMQLLKTFFNWVEGRECLYMDGQIEEKQRQNSIDTLNDPKSEVKVLLASIKACSEGINLVGASRVVLLDVHWNPSVERQAISRAYRLGQKKLVYVYHLVTGSMEGEKYIRQVEKSHLSELVFSSKNKDCSNPTILSTVSKDKILEEMVQHDRLQNMFEKVIYQPKEADLIDTFG